MSHLLYNKVHDHLHQLQNLKNKMADCKSPYIHELHSFLDSFEYDLYTLNLNF